MSYRIARMMGWGMPWSKFEELAILPEHEDGKSESLYSIFSKVTDEQMTIPKDYCSWVFNTPNVPMILDSRLLSEVFTKCGRKEAKIVSGVKLFTLVSNPDNTTDVIFYPSAYYAKEWHRRNDDLDYAFEAWSREVKGKKLGERGAQSGPRDFTIYTGYNPYPFSSHLMLEDGTPQSWDHYHLIEKRPDLLPAVPSEIRWYLKELKVLDDAGINQLRPCIAQVWS